MIMFIKKMNIWMLGFFVVVLVLIALLSVGQAITLAWLSSFPEQAERIEVLKTKFWVYLFTAIVASIFSVIGIVRIIKLNLNKNI